jgi:hypothetical protein
MIELSRRCSLNPRDLNIRRQIQRRRIKMPEKLFTGLSTEIHSKTRRDSLKKSSKKITDI